MSQTVEDDFRAWVSANRDRLRQTAYLLSGDWHLADDLVQDALARAFGVWARVTSRGNPDAYVRKIVVNLHLDHRRRPARREQTMEEFPEVSQAGSFAETADERERLLSALAAVPPGQRAVLVLRFWDDFSIQQTSQALGRSTGHVKSQTSRGLAALRVALGDEHPITAHGESEAS